jgi:hypothetical protein
MFCDRCGTQLEQNQRFCPSCGKPLGAVPAALPANRVQGHIRLLGILWLVSSAIHMLPGLFLLTFFRRGMVLPPDVPLFVTHLLQLVGFAVLAGSVLGIMAGWGLLERQPWARMLAIVLGVLHLLNLPFGTALGIYTLWVLLPAESEAEYAHMSGIA